MSHNAPKKLPEPVEFSGPPRTVDAKAASLFKTLGSALAYTGIAVGGAVVVLVTFGSTRTSGATRSAHLRWQQREAEARQASCSPDNRESEASRE